MIIPVERMNFGIAWTRVARLSLIVITEGEAETVHSVCFKVLWRVASFSFGFVGVRTSPYIQALSKEIFVRTDLQPLVKVSMGQNSIARFAMFFKTRNSQR